LIVDTIGDLKRYYAMSDVAYIGGSLHFRGSNKGGHNLMEPAILGIAPIFGPYNFSFQETVRALLDGNAGLQVSDQAEIYHVLRRFLDNPGTAAEMGARARQVILGNRGATDLNFALIEPYISRR
jgi:3-deoxy-D-manno-octulosonic-acid transferase